MTGVRIVGEVTGRVVRERARRAGGRPALTAEGSESVQRRGAQSGGRGKSDRPVDHRGHGDSDWAHGYGWLNDVLDLAMVIRGLGTPVFLLGHS